MRWLLPVFFALLTGACSLNLTRGPQSLRGEIVDTARAQIGVPYQYAGADPNSGFDCSGLVYYSYAQAGIQLPRSTQELIARGAVVAYEQAQPGDLLFYRFEDQKKSNLHVVIYAGDGYGVHAPSSGRGVSTIRVTEPVWTQRYLGAVSVLPAATE